LVVVFAFVRLLISLFQISMALRPIVLLLLFYPAWLAAQLASTSPVAPRASGPSRSVSAENAAASERHRHAADAHWHAGRYAEALDEAERAVRLNPANVLAYVSRGLARQDGKHDYAGAVADFSQALKLDARCDAAWLNRGWAYHQQQKLGPAVADYTRSLEINPQNDLAYTNRGWAYHQQQKLALAVADYTRALELNPQNDLAYINRGWARQQQNQLKAAIDDYNKALELNSGSDLAYTNRGAAYWAQDRLDDALADFQKALQLNRHNTLAAENLARLEKQLAARGAVATKSTQRSKPPVPTAGATPDEKIPQSAAAGPKPERQPTVWLVAVGIGTYQQSHMFGASLDFTVPGMYEFVRLVERRALCRERPVVLAESRAKRQAILDALADLTDPQRVGPDDMIVFFYSGHGLMAGPTIGICPYDYTDPSTLISDEEITAILRRSPARHKLCLIEACKSSAGMGIEPGSVEHFNQKRREIAGGLAYLTSTRAGAPSWGENGKGGYFTQYLLEGLDQGLADADHDRIVTVGEIFAYVRERVSGRTNRQQVPEINAAGYDARMPVMIVPRK
jgi:tetratricopeptide (TPR) repeat protein